MHCISQNTKRIFSIPQNQVFQIHIHSIHAFANSNFNLEKSISIKFPKSHSKIDFLKIWICQWYFKYFPNSKFDFLSYISKFEFKEIKFFKAISHFSKSIFTKTSRFFRNRFSLSQIQHLKHDSRFSKSLFSKYFPIFEANIMFSNMHFHKFIAHAWFFMHLGIRRWFR